jgi:hypothetical protein
VPELGYPVQVDFGGDIELLGFDLNRRGDALAAILHWRARREMEHDYSFFLHLFEPGTERIVAQWDGVPRNYSTTRWAVGEVVSAEITLELEAVRPGRYRLATGVYDPRTGQRLLARGNNIDHNRAILVDSLAWP